MNNDYFNSSGKITAAVIDAVECCVVMIRISLFTATGTDRDAYTPLKSSTGERRNQFSQQFHEETLL